MKVDWRTVSVEIWKVSSRNRKTNNSAAGSPSPGRMSTPNRLSDLRHGASPGCTREALASASAIEF